MSIVTKGLGSPLLITQGYGTIDVFVLIDPYCEGLSPYSQTADVYQPFTRIGTCLSEIIAQYDTMTLWHLQLKQT